jgi:hypothetical protein
MAIELDHVPKQWIYNNLHYIGSLRKGTKMSAKSENGCTPLPLVALLFFTRTGDWSRFAASRVTNERKGGLLISVSNSVCSYVARQKHRKTNCVATSLRFSLLSAVTLVSVERKMGICVAKLENYHAAFRRNSRDLLEMKCHVRCFLIFWINLLRCAMFGNEPPKNIARKSLYFQNQKCESTPFSSPRKRVKKLKKTILFVR